MVDCCFYTFCILTEETRRWGSGERERERERCEWEVLFLIVEKEDRHRFVTLRSFFFLE